MRAECFGNLLEGSSELIQVYIRKFRGVALSNEYPCILEYFTQDYESTYGLKSNI